jgi:NhaP-type Na+/H+ or K+/H+ antiporter
MADAYLVFLVAGGLLVLLVAWLPPVLRELPLSLPIICVAIGYGIFALLGTGAEIHPLRHPDVSERLAEFVVIIALMGAGLKLDRPFGWRTWRITWRLLAVTMPLSILGIALVAWLGLGLPLAAALLLGAALAPTDPVLAADIQVGPPGSGEEDEVRFALTSEAGLNDGLAFPFVHLALAAAAVGLDGGSLGHWFALDLVWRLAAGLAMGWLIGRAAGWVIFRLPSPSRLSHTGDGFVALGITMLSYALTEMVHGYGFLAVFITALVLRNADRQHDYNEDLHDFAEQLERLLMMAVLVLFGGALAGGLLAPLGWVDVTAGLAILFIVRPLAGWIGLISAHDDSAEIAMIAFFGIRGIGSFFYLAYALNHAGFGEPERLWAITGFIVLVSIVIHGATVTPLIRRLDRR